MTQAEQTIAGVALPRERGRRVRRTHELTGWAWAGSQRQIQAYTNTPPLLEVLDREIRVALPVLAGTALEWRSPLATEHYEEPTGEGFWSAIDQPRLRAAAAGWWPRRGPSWDAIALARDGLEPATVVLVEAKANVAEFTAGPLAARAEASVTIRFMLRSTAPVLRCGRRNRWMRGQVCTISSPTVLRGLAGSGKPGSARCSRTCCSMTIARTSRRRGASCSRRRALASSRSACPTRPSGTGS